MAELDGQVAIVTGATRGIGKAVASALLRAGARVAGTYRANEAAAAAFRAEAEAAGRPLSLSRCDAADPAAVEAFYKDFQASGDRLDILVCNSGIRRDAAVALQKEEDWEAVLATNLSGTFRMAKHAVRMMSGRRYGRVLFVTSPAGRVGFAGQGAYAASKAGQVGLMRSLCKEVASRNITVNCLSPGFVDTEFLAGLKDAQLAAYRESVPLGRFGRPEEIAAAALFLVSPGASYVSGAVLEAAGGL